jgi:hypothetical protein
MAEEKKKEMLGVSVLPDGRTKVSINYSSLSVIQTCMRKAYYVLHKQLMSMNKSNALVFGSAIHKALEVWYLSDTGERIIPTNLEENLRLEVYGHTQGEAIVYQAAKAFRQEMEPLWYLPETDKRCLSNGAKILAKYFRTYRDDGLVVLADDKGPIVEREMRFTMLDAPDLVIEYFGTVDAVLHNKATGLTCVADHKTTSSLGTDFFNRVKPNHQYTGYVMAAKRCLGLETDMFMINGLQVAKTKQEFARQFTERTEEDFQNLTASVTDAVRRYLKAIETGIWPQSAPDPCTLWGGCQFLKVCEVPNKLKQHVLDASWNE